MKTQHMPYSRLLDGIRDEEATTLEYAHRDAALDEALCESFPASDPIAVSFIFADGPDLAKVPDRNAQIEINNPR